MSKISASFAIPLEFGDYSTSSFYINHNFQSELEVSGDLYGKLNDNLSASIDVTGSESYRFIGTKVEMELDYLRS
ncbi:hypothetical protein O9993_07045 [Vibrio lentus]|nr:hypothetical protein [Vibrio lentus]